MIHLPTGRPINPISKTNWEQTGIEPHVAVPAEQALDRAYRLALEKRLQVVTEEERRSRITWAIEGLNARLNPLKVEAGRLGKYVGEYGERKITQEGGDLLYRRTKARYRLFPLKENVFGVSRLDSFRIEFVVDRQGKVTGLVGVFEDGTRDPSERTK